MLLPINKSHSISGIALKSSTLLISKLLASKSSSKKKAAAQKPDLVQITELEREMQAAAERLDFERAIELRERLMQLKNTTIFDED